MFKISALSFFLFFMQLCHGQQTSKPYYLQFDEITNSYSSDLNNGKRFENLYLTISDDEFRFFNSKQSTIGNVSYNGQSFYEISLKYDLLEDDLLFKNEKVKDQYYVILNKFMDDA